VKRLLLPLLVALALVAGACGSDSDVAYKVEESTVTVGGEEITIPAVEADVSSVDEQLDDIVESDEFVDFVEASGGVVRSTDGGLDSEYVAQYLSDRIVFDVIAAEFERRGLEISDEDRAAGQAELEGRLAPAADPSLPPDEQGPTGDEVLSLMPASYRDFLVDSFARVGVLSEVLTEESVPSDEEVRAAYDADPSQWELACGAHILIATNEDPAAGDVVTAEQAEAGAVFVLNTLEAGGDFAEVARTRSDDPGSGAQGGDLGCAPRGAYVPEFEEALFGAEPGEIVGPVTTAFGSHVIRLDEIQTEFEDVEETIRQQLAGQEDPFSAFIQLVLQDADVTVNERYGEWNAEEGRVVARQGPSATTTTVPVLELPEGLEPPTPTG
jgi:hypothetical protein